MNKVKLSILLRKLRLIYFTDLIRYYWQRFKNKKINRAFKIKNPTVLLPPDYLLYETFQLNYEKYYTESFETAKWLTNYFKKYINLTDLNILDWGCGPGRIIRHLPAIIGQNCNYYGTDYNIKSINWCKENLKGISFNHNSLHAILPYPDNFFDIIYGISIFTHLSEQLHYDWYKELTRIIKPTGILFLTTQGDNFKSKLTTQELKKYNAGQLIVRGHVKEGHRTFSAFQPAEFMIALCHKNNTSILEHTTPPIVNNKWLPQDIWIMQKKQ